MSALVSEPRYARWILTSRAEVEEYEKKLESRTGWDRWMAGRRLGDMYEQLGLQRRKVHTYVAGCTFGSVDFAVCSCSLMVQVSYNALSAECKAALEGADGHVDFDPVD